jgi:hypothetical protein
MPIHILSDGALSPEQVVEAASRRAWTHPIWIDELAAG